MSRFKKIVVGCVIATLSALGLHMYLKSKYDWSDFEGFHLSENHQQECPVREYSASMESHVLSQVHDMHVKAKFQGVIQTHCAQKHGVTKPRYILPKRATKPEWSA